MPDDQQLDGLQDKLGYWFSDKALLIEALSHSSYVNENADADASSNERMEFLGDSVLGLLITQYLFKHYPDCSEGELTLMKSVLVSEVTLAGIAQRIELGPCLFLGKGEATSGGAERASNLSNAIEALLAAIYLDAGLEETRRITEGLFKTDLGRIATTRHSLNYKNLLQHYSQEREGAIPDYVLLGSHGPQHEKLFEIEVRIKGVPLGKGCGRSKKEAEQEAARAALDALGVQ